MTDPTSQGKPRPRYQRYPNSRRDLPMGWSISDISN